MQPGQFACQIQADSMARSSGRRRVVMKSLEDVFSRWNCAAIIADGQHNVSAVGVGPDQDPPAGAIVLSRVLQQILHNEGRVLSFASYEKAEWKFFFNL